MSFIIAAIGTDIGKTVISAIICEALAADYWKPVQAGDLDHTDSDKVRALISDPNIKIHAEAHRLTAPMSPHAAARLDNTKIELSDFTRPATHAPLIIEMAGGLMVPLSEELMMTDLMIAFDLPVILVANFYLGSINHTLLSAALLKSLNIPTAGIIFNGNMNAESRDIILKHIDMPCLGHIPYAQHLTKDFVTTHAQSLRHALRLARL